MICKARIIDNLVLYRSLPTPRANPKAGHVALRAYVFFYVFLKGTSHFLSGFAQTPPLLHCLLLRVPVCDSFGIVPITVGFAFGSSLYILQHVRQHPTHNKCIILDRVGVEQSKRASEKGENS